MQKCRVLLEMDLGAGSISNTSVRKANLKSMSNFSLGPSQGKICRDSNKSLSERHSREGGVMRKMVGATGIEPVTPTMSM